MAVLHVNRNGPHITMILQIVADTIASTPPLGSRRKILKVFGGQTMNDERPIHLYKRQCRRKLIPRGGRTDRPANSGRRHQARAA